MCYQTFLDIEKVVLLELIKICKESEEEVGQSHQSVSWYTIYFYWITLFSKVMHAKMSTWIEMEKKSLNDEGEKQKQDGSSFTWKIHRSY